MPHLDSSSEKVRNNGDDAVREAAARWWVQLNDPPVSADTAKAFKVWIEASPQNKRAFEATQRAWTYAGETTFAVQARQVYSRRRLLRNLTLATGAGFAGVTGIYLAGSSYPFADYGTATGKRKSLQLPDGSQLELSTRTKLDVRFNQAKRQIHVYEGEVYCKVAKDISRPFCVTSHLATATALGTEFSVLAGRDRTRIAVTQHSVRVATHTTDVVAEQGQSVSITDAGIGAPESFSPSLLAWRSGRLEFLSAPFGQVVSQLNQWQHGKIFLADSRLAALPVTMLIDLSRIAESIRKLPMVLPVKVAEISPLLTVIYAA